MLLEYIHESDNKKQGLINELKASIIPNIIYGIGSYATDLMKLLDKQEINVSAACVDRAYFKESKKFLNKFKVIPFEILDRYYDRYNIIIGFSDYRLAYKKLKDKRNVNKIYFIDSPDHIHFFDYQYILNHIKQFEFTYQLLKDKISKNTMSAFINSKITGEIKELLDVYDKNQYFNELIPFGENEVFVDCGAFTGDTILNFINRTNNKYHGIYAFEPDKSSHGILMDTIEKNDIKNITVINKGCWCKSDKLSFVSNSERSSICNVNSNYIIEVEAIDNVINQDKVSFIKMDIEGAELQALYGARNTIERDKPNLAICVYHKPEDLITIPQLIYNMVPEYKFYLRHHQFVSWDTVLYATIR